MMTELKLTSDPVITEKKQRLKNCPTSLPGKGLLPRATLPHYHWFETPTRPPVSLGKNQTHPPQIPSLCPISDVLLLLFSRSVMTDSLQPHGHQASLSFTISWSLIKLMSVELEMPANRVIFYHSIFLLPSIFPSLEVFSNTSNICIMWPKYWSLSFSISPSNEYPWLVSFWIDWFDLLVLQGTLESSPTPRFKMIWGGWWEGGSELGTHVHPWRIHVNVWQNQYSIVK